MVLVSPAPGLAVRRAQGRARLHPLLVVASPDLTGRGNLTSDNADSPRHPQIDLHNISLI